jgi:hypothetical protein
MSLTPEQRAEISRQNGMKSRGPVTDEGKAVSRRNALKHGLRAEVLPLPTEDPEVIQARADAWNTYYQPQSPVAQHLVTQCVQATLLADRVHRAHSATLSRQVRNAVDDFDRACDDQVESLKRLLKTDPAEAVRLLKRSSDGCTYLLGRWGALGAALTERGRWTGPERDEAIRLIGHDPDPETLKTCPEAWLTRLYNLMLLKNPSESSVRWLLGRIPDRYRAIYNFEALPDEAESLERLREMIAEQVVPLEEEEERLSAEREEADRDEAPDRALVLQDAPSARLFLRYHAEARLSFHKAYSELIKTLERDKAAAAESVSTPAPSPSPAAAAAEPPKEPGTDAADAWPSPFEPGPPVSEAEVWALAAVLRGKDGLVVPLVTPVS